MPLPNLTLLRPQPDGGADDAELLRRFAGHHDEAAFELLVWRHGGMVLATCRRLLGRSADADDAFQVTFLALAQRAGSIHTGAALPGWLHRVARRAALRVKSSRRERPTGGLPEPAVEPVQPDDLGPVLDEEIDRLPEKLRRAFVLCHLEGVSNEAAAERLGCPTGTVQSRLSRARERLRERLSRRGVVASIALAAPAATPLSATTAASTARAAAAFAAGSAPGGVPVRVVTTTHGLLRSMRLTPRRPVSLLLALVLAGGVGLAATAGRPAPPAADPPPPPAERPVAAAQPAQPAERVLDTEKHGLKHVDSAQLSPDGSVAVLLGCEPDALAREVVLTVWDTATGRLRHKSVGAYWGGPEVAPDGKTFTVTTRDDGLVLVHDAATGREVRRLDHPCVLFAVHSPDGRHVLSGSYWDGRKALREVRVWDAATGRRLARVVPAETETLTLAGFARGGRVVFDTGHGVARVFDLATGRERDQVAVGNGAVVSVAPDDTTLLALVDGRPRLIDLTGGATVRVFGRPDVRYASAGRSPDGTRVVAATAGNVEDCRVTVWDAASGEERLGFPGSCLDIGRGHFGRGPFTADGRLLLAAWCEGADARGNSLHWAAVYGPDGRLLRKESGVKSLRFDRAARRVLVVAGSEPMFENTPADVVTVHDAAEWLAGGGKTE